MIVLSLATLKKKKPELLGEAKSILKDEIGNFESRETSIQQVLAHLKVHLEAKLSINITSEAGEKESYQYTNIKISVYLIWSCGL